MTGPTCGRAGAPSTQRELELELAALVDAGELSPRAQKFAERLLEHVSRGTCRLCKHDQDAPLGHVDEVFVPEIRPTRGFKRNGDPHVLQIVSHNMGRPGNPKARRHAYRYQKDVDLWYEEFAYHCRGGRLHSLDGRVRVEITRHMAPGKHDFDHANLVGGCKRVVDAAKHAGIITDDNTKHFEGFYHQERATGEPGTTLRFSELPGPQRALL